ncbi:Nitrate transporter 1.7 [Platanthera guangdongensis]|uniref:Nitrate transporter 1.7 n=1 Tax=Platanthera guangdongensis TaxID=2320717 RepID=A0ABR2LDV1_9ASPA
MAMRDSTRPVTAGFVHPRRVAASCACIRSGSQTLSITHEIQAIMLNGARPTHVSIPAGRPDWTAVRLPQLTLFTPRAAQPSIGLIGTRHIEVRVVEVDKYTRPQSSNFLYEELNISTPHNHPRCSTLLTSTTRHDLNKPPQISNETFEKLAEVGLLANMTVYLMDEYHIDAMNAANIINIFFGTTNFAPLVGAFVSDAYLGRFRTLAYSSVVSFLGMVTITLTAALPRLHPPSCRSQLKIPQELPCTASSSLHLGVLYLAMTLLVIGAGGIRPCSLPFGVDQFDCATEKGRRELARFYNWYYWTSTVAVFISLIVMVYIQNYVSWSVGFAIPTALMLLAILLFFIGAPLYVHVSPEGSIFSGIAQVFVAAFRNRRLSLPSTTTATALYNPASLSAVVTPLPHTPGFPCLTKAAIFTAGSPPASPWRLCSLQQIEEVKCLIRIVPIWASGIPCFVAFVQQWSFVVLQSMKMNRRLGHHFTIPPGMVGAVSMLGLSLFIPLYEAVVVPAARRLANLEAGFTTLQRQGAGLAASVISMAAAAAVEKQRRGRSLRGVEISVAWLAPQLLLMGAAEALNAVGQIEFYNRQFPEHMQTLAGSLFFCSMGSASYLCGLLVTAVRRMTGGEGRRGWLENDIDEGRLEYFYYLLAGMGAVNLMGFLVCAHFYRYNKDFSRVKEDGCTNEP